MRKIFENYERYFIKSLSSTARFVRNGKLVVLTSQTTQLRQEFTGNGYRM